MSDSTPDQRPGTPEPGKKDVMGGPQSTGKKRDVMGGAQPEEIDVMGGEQPEEIDVMRPRRDS